VHVPGVQCRRIHQPKLNSLMPEDRWQISPDDGRRVSLCACADRSGNCVHAGIGRAFQPLVPDQLPRYPRPDELVGIPRSFGSILLPSTDFVDACEPYSLCNDRSLEMQILRSGLSPTL